MDKKFYICRHCGNLVGMINSSGVPIVCCGENMQALQPNTTEASGEKHLPVIKRAEDLLTVQVGSAAHPMVEEHFIQWIYLQTEHGGMRRALQPGDAPEATFCLAGETPVAVYAYCNLHGLWMTQL